jgi:hypothetical protein
VDPSDIQYCLDRYDKIQKSIDVGYRTGWPSREMFRLGKWGALKFEIAELFLDKAKNLKLDIGIGKNVLTGTKWFDFMLACKYTIGVESGASLLDKDGSIYQAIQNALKLKPEASFEEIEKKCFPGLDGNLNLKAISPRIFEAALTKTCMVLVEGEYNGILQPQRHYIPLKRDFSNIDEVVKILSQDQKITEIVENVYEDLIENGHYLYSDFISDFQKAVPTKTSNISSLERLFYQLSLATDTISWLKAGIWSQLVVPLRRKLSL